MTWREEFREALVKAIWAGGAIVGKNANIYGWYDFDATDHIRQCSLGSHTSVVEDRWEEFGGTFTSNDLIIYGVTMNVTCECGEVVDRPIRWEESFADALKKILMEG